MRILRVITALPILAAVSMVAVAAPDQTFTFVPQGVIPNTAAIDKATLTPATAVELIDQTLGQKVRQSKDFYCMIHILRWKDNSTDVDKQNWYVYHDGKGWSETQFGAGRIFGSHNVAFLFVHANARGLAKSDIPDSALATASGGSNRQKLNALADGIELTDNNAGFQIKSSDSKFLSTLGRYVVHSDYYRVQYKAEVSAKLPHMISDLASLLFPSAQSNEAGIPTVPVAVWGGAEMFVEPVPSDISVTGARIPAASVLAAAASPVELGKKTFDNEGRYWWDISAGIPLKGIKQLDFDTATQGVAPKEISRQSILAFANVFPMKIDTKADRQGIVPVLLVGMGVSNKALDRVVFAGGIGINKVQFFVGTAYTNKQFAGATPGSVMTNRRTNLIYGINLPLRQAVQLLKKSK